ncbi:MAG: hypothetical protein ACI8QS_000628 [Planctomycetota bacterium]|jgi:hypothetical protein
MARRSVLAGTMTVLALVVMVLVVSLKGEGAKSEVATRGAVAPTEGIVVAPVGIETVTMETVDLGERAEVAATPDKERSEPQSSATTGESPSAASGERQPLFYLSARFVDSGSRPVPFAEAHLYNRRPRSQFPFQAIPSIGLVSDASGVMEQVAVYFEGQQESDWLGQQVFVFATETHGSEPIMANTSRGDTLDLGIVPMELAGTVRGRAIDMEGNPINGPARSAEIQFFHTAAALGTISVDTEIEDAEHVGHLGGIIQEDGSFTAYNLPLHKIVYAALSADFTDHGISAPIVLTELDPVATVDVQVSIREDTKRISGQVLLPNGEPAIGAIAHAQTNPGFSPPYRDRVTVSEEDASFEFTLQGEGSGSDAGMDVWAVLPGTGFRPAHLPNVEMDTSDVRLQLGEESVFEVRVVDPTGAAIPWANVRSRSTTGQPPYGYDTDELHPGMESGVVQLPLPLGSYVLTVFAPGFATKTHKGQAAPADGEVVTVEMQQGFLIQGRVTSGGEPVGGAQVGILLGYPRGTSHPSGSPTHPHAPVLLNIPGQDRRHDATTDTDGRFVAIPHWEGTLFLSVESPGFPPSVGEAFVFDGSHDVNINFDLKPAGRMKGRAEGVPSEEFSRYVVAASKGTSNLRVAQISSDGSWSLDDLQPGSWQVRALRAPLADRTPLRAMLFSDGDPLASWRRWDTVIRPDSTTTVTVDLGELEGCVLEGAIHFKGVHGEDDSALAWSAHLTPISSDGQLVHERGITAGLSADGSFRLTSGMEGEYSLEFRERGMRSNRILAGKVLLRKGVQRRETRVDLASLTLRYSTPSQSDGVIGGSGLRRYFVVSQFDTGWAHIRTSFRPRPDNELDTVTELASGTISIGQVYTSSIDLAIDPTQTPFGDATIWTESVTSGQGTVALID